MSTRLALTVVGTVVGAYFGYPQLGAMAGAMIGSAVDPTTIQGPRINESGTQTVAEGVPRTVVFGTWKCTGNVIQRGPLVKVQTSTSQGKGSTKVKGEIGLRTFAIGICEGPVEGLLRVWQDNKLVYDMTPGSGMLNESQKWIANKRFYTGDEAQLPDPDLELLDPDATAHRGSCYMVFIQEDVTTLQGAISQYEFEVATSLSPATVNDLTGSTLIDTYNPGSGYLTFPVFLSPLNASDVQVGTIHAQQRISPASTYEIITVDDACAQVGANAISVGGDSWGAIPGFGNDLQFLGYRGNYGIATDTVSGTGVNWCFLTNGGALQATLVPTGAETENDWFNFGANNQRRLWFSEGHVFLGNTSRGGVNYNNICRWSLGSSGREVAADAISGSICATPGAEFFMHLGRDNKVRVIADTFAIQTYNYDLTPDGTPEALPFSAGSYFDGFGVDAQGQVAVFVYCEPSVGKIEVRRTTDWSLLATYTDAGLQEANAGYTRVVFNETGCFVQCGRNVLRFAYASQSGGESILLSEIVSDIWSRCGVQSLKYDVGELTDTVRGYGLSSAGYTGADAIDSLRMAYFFDKCVRDKKAFHPKRGKPVVKTITTNDLTQIPESTRREQTSEIPYKLNVRYPNADSGWAVLKETTGSWTPDRRTTGEVTLDVPVSLSSDEAAQIADKQYKTMLAEVAGTVELSVMLDVGAELAEADCIAYSGDRLRIEESEFADWALKFTLKADRQSAYTSNVTGIPAPPPELPPSTIPGDTEMAIIDGPARTDSEDDISYLAAVTGALPSWYGATLQRSLDGGATYTDVYDFDTAAVMGVLLEGVAAASPYFTDTTNTVKVQFYRSTASIDSLTQSQFLSRQGVFALVDADGAVEYLQGRDVEVKLDETVHITTLHRGVANTSSGAHAAGTRFVWLADATYIPASSAWLNEELTHRAVSFGETEDDTTNQDTQTYAGKSQQEWAPAYLRLARDGSTVSATWDGRGRFGNAFSPVMSRNFTGYRVTATDGVTTETVDTATPTYSGSWASSVTVTVVALNRITGAGPSTSGTI